MNPEVKAALAARLKADEGVRLRAYICPAGKVSIGVGRNLEDVGVSHAEAEMFLANDIERICGELDRHFPGWQRLAAARQIALASMAFNLGITRLLGFKRFRAALDRSDFTCAAREMLDSKWAQQVGERASRLALMMERGD